MERESGTRTERGGVLSRNFRAPFSRVPLLGWLAGILVAVTLERLAGAPVALALGLQKVPVLFGFVIMLKKPALIPGAVLYVLLIYAIPTAVVTRLGISPANRLAAWLVRFPKAIPVAVHLALLYAALHLWAG